MYLVKFGGNAIRGKDDLDRLSKEIAWLIDKGVKIVLIHGGGPEISDEMEKRGLKPKKIAGERITDEDALEVAKDVLKALNKDVVDSLTDAGVNAVGIPGYKVIQARRKPPIKAVDENGMEIMVDLGLVGEVDSVDIERITQIIDEGKLPVIYPISAGPEGYLNVNADTVAAGVAAAMKVREMVLISDVPGILTDVNDPSSKLDRVTIAEIDELISTGVISGGMIPKVNACKAAIEVGVGKVRMVNGKDGESILMDIVGDKPHGTMITR